jgi:signal transduction histidine kinase
VFVAQSHRQIFRRQLHALQENPSVRDWEVWLQPRNKQGFLSSISISAMLDSQGELIGFRWSIRDLTDRQKLEDFRIQLETQTKVSQFKSRIIRTLSHEFRTPLNLIYLSCQMLERYYEGIARDKTTPLFDKIRLGIRNMTSLLEDALLFDKGERQQLEFKPAQLDLNEFCAHVIREQLFLHSRSDRAIDFVPCNECQSVCLDAKLLKHIVENLLCNALKYTPSERFIYFTLNCNKNNVMLTVKDEGRGIPEDDLPYLFEAFHRAANVGGIGGSGLGLAIVQKCVEAHGGTIQVESHLNEGSTFTVTLPIARF